MLVAGGREQTTASTKINHVTANPALPKHMGSGQGGMPTKIDFTTGRKPAKHPFVGLQMPGKCRFRKIHLRCHILHPLRRLPAGQNANSGRIARERATSKRIDNVKGTGHMNSCETVGKFLKITVNTPCFSI